MNKIIAYSFLLICFLQFNNCKNSLESNTNTSPKIATETSANDVPKLDLEYLAFPPEKASSSNELPPLLLLLHGYGSNKEDMLNFKKYIDERFFVISVQAPNDLGNGRYAWYNLDFSSKKLRANTEEAKISQAKLIKFIHNISKKYEINTQKIYLTGFSQGAIMSLGTAFRIPSKIAGIAALSGRLPRHIDLDSVDKSALKNFPIFVSHGTKDMVIQLDEAHKTRDFLETSTAAKLTYREYEMAHTISRDNLKDLLQWMKVN